MLVYRRDVGTQRRRNKIKKHVGGKIGRFYRRIDKGKVKGNMPTFPALVTERTVVFELS